MNLATRQRRGVSANRTYPYCLRRCAGAARKRQESMAWMQLSAPALSACLLVGGCVGEAWDKGCLVHAVSSRSATHSYCSTRARSRYERCDVRWWRIGAEDGEREVGSGGSAVGRDVREARPAHSLVRQLARCQATTHFAAAAPGLYARAAIPWWRQGSHAGASPPLRPRPPCATGSRWSSSGRSSSRSLR